MGCFGARWTATRKASLEWTCLCTRYQEKGSRYKGPQWTYSEHVCVPKWKNAWRYQSTISQNQKGCDTTGHSEHVCVPCETRSRPSQTRIAMKNAHRRFWKAETYENYHAKPIQGHPGPAKSMRTITKNRHRRSWRAGSHKNDHAILSATIDQTIPEHRRARELPQKMHIEESKKLKNRKHYKNCQAKPGPDHRGQPESTRIATRNENANTKVQEIPRILSATSNLTQRFSLSIRTLSVKHTVWGTMTKRFHVI